MKPTYEEAHSSEVFRQEAELRMKEGTFEAERTGIDWRSPENQVANLNFHAVLIENLFGRVVALEKYAQKLEEQMDGNRFTTKGIEL